MGRCTVQTQDYLIIGGTLDLSNQTLDVGTCAVLGKILQISNVISKASFGDCLLKEDGIKSILLGLCGNSSVKTLSLKGNSIQGSSIHALAKMLRHNITVIRLSLEWNNLGLCSESFTSFCEALGSNSALQYLDLRSNQLGVDCGTHLARALARNCSLTSLDLRWNNIGRTGGKALLESLHHNRTLSKVDLVGNGIPNEDISAIEMQLSQNSRSAIITNEYTSRTDILKQQLEDRERYSAQQIEYLERSLAQTDLTLNKTVKESMFQTGKLEEQLRSKSVELEALEAKYELVNSALRLNQERVTTLEARNNTLEEELRKSQEAALLQNKNDKEVLEHVKSEHNQEVRSLQKTISQLEAQVAELEFKCNNQKMQIFDFKETICSLQSEIKGIRIECDEMMAAEAGKYKESLRNVDLQYNAEIQRMKKDHQQMETEMREKCLNSETLRGEVQAEAAALRLQISTERSSNQAQLLSLKQQLKAEQATVVRGMEEQLHAMEDSRNDGEERLRVQIASNSTLSAANAKLSAQLHALRNDIAELNVKLEDKEVEVRAAEKRVRDEFAGQLIELQQECEKTSKLNNVILDLKRTISELEHESNVHKRDVRMREDELQKLREDEARRIGMLHSAFLSYFNTSLGSPTNPR
ncbi:leucine-rich repeat-containing protein 45 isoform X2 [Procambarus clarkii]|uniref:leucine-rich repeat-containing protein 45 isoform X2 n=1 Tax=Procambarus clarkii TaxID=6728 RepID=UPI001E672E03|nr:leucine-rich repeat-containing protein 45-like isoform X2 [Procambarus clarkii]